MGTWVNLFLFDKIINCAIFQSAEFYFSGGKTVIAYWESDRERGRERERKAANPKYKTSKQCILDINIFFRYP